MWQFLEKFTNRIKRSKLRDLLEDLDPPPKAPPLVIGTAINYAEPALRPFVVSLRKSGYKGRILFFVRNLSEDTKSFLRTNAVEMIEIPDRYRNYHIQNSRWFHYLDYLQDIIVSRQNLPSQILFTDVRDVFFQANPFHEDVKYLELFLENETPCLGECHYNSLWIRMCYGEQVLAEMSSKTISCCGTVFGSTKGSIDYLLRMETLLKSMSSRAKRKALDQGPHNYLIHKKELPNTLVLENGGRVFTVGYTPESEILISNDHSVLTTSGYRSPVIHQFDRHPKILIAIEAQLQN